MTQGAPEGGQNPPTNEPGQGGQNPPANPPAPPAQPDTAAVDAANKAQKDAEDKLAKAQQDQADLIKQLGQALGLTPKDGDPATQLNELTGNLQTVTGERDTLQGRVAELEAELLVHNVASAEGVNAAALLDSRKFLGDLAKLDPKAADYAAKVTEAVKAAATATPSLRAGQAPSSGGAPNAGQGAGGNGAVVTADQFKAMGYKAKAELFASNPELYRQLSA